MLQLAHRVGGRRRTFGKPPLMCQFFAAVSSDSMPKSFPKET